MTKSDSSPSTSAQDKQAKKQRKEMTTNPDAMRVLVPVSNPRTAPHLIEFASSVCDPERGKIKALFVNVPDSPYPDAKADVEHVVKRAKERGLPVEFVAVMAPNVPRGVLDAIREQNSDLLVLGFQAPKEGKFVFGEVTEAIARDAVVDMVVYRHAFDAELKRVVVPVTDLPGSRKALIHAIHIAEVYEIPVEALYVRTPADEARENTRAWSPIVQLYGTLFDLPGGQQVQPRVIEGQDLVTGVVNECSKEDLVVLSVEEGHRHLDRWLFGITAQKMLRLAPGPIALVKRATEEVSIRQQLVHQVERWIPRMTAPERSNVIQEASEIVRANTNYVVMIIISSVLASIGLLQNSAAVIIGAMLVAPLMSPLMGFGVGMVLGEANLMQRSVRTVLMGVALVLLFAFLIGVIAGIPLPTNEMLSRGEPTLLDLIVALGAGMAGAFAMVRKDIPAALAGVAIAAALVPPICTTGLAVALGEYTLALGAGTLSLVNIIGISIAAAITFGVMGLIQESKSPLRQRLAVSGVVLGIMAIPLAFLLYTSSTQTMVIFETEQVIEDELADAKVLEIELEDSDPLQVTVMVRSPHAITVADVEHLEQRIEGRVNRNIALEIVHLDVIRIDSSPKERDSLGGDD